MSVKFKSVSSEATGRFVFGVVLGVANFWLMFWLVGFLTHVDLFWRICLSLTVFVVFVSFGFSKAVAFFKTHYVVEEKPRKGL